MTDKKFDKDEIKKIVQEELNELVKEILEDRLSYEVRFERDDLLYTTIKNVIEESLGDSKHLRTLNIEGLVKEVLKVILKPKLENLVIKLNFEPEIMKGGKS